jgi:pantoate--beta-alanine ligase
VKIFHTIREVRDHIGEQKRVGRTVGFVPTMGFLHEGHLSLVAHAKQECDLVVMSIFVNPLQFGPNEDFERYPRDLDRDEALAREAGVDVLFTPSVEEMYPRPSFTFVEVEGLTKSLCGESRPGHFRGVATVVTKLFNIVQPQKAYFGQKDFQQVRVIEQMVEDLNMPVEIVACPIVREPDGLALSSRNVYLSPEERKQALSLYASLREVEKAFAEGERNAARLIQISVDRIKAEPLADIDYVRIVNRRTLTDVETINEPALFALAVRFGKTRLIDNTLLQP